MHIPSTLCQWVGASLELRPYPCPGSRGLGTNVWVVAWAWRGHGQVNQGELCAPLHSTRLARGTDTLAAACTCIYYCTTASLQIFAIGGASSLGVCLCHSSFSIPDSTGVPAGHRSVPHGPAGSGCPILCHSQLNMSGELERELQLVPTQAANVPLRQTACRPLR